MIFATGPVHLDEDGEELREELGAVLTASLGAPVQVRSTRTYAEVEAMVARSEAHAAWLPPAVYVRAEARHGATAVAAVERSAGADYHGVLFVRSESERREPGDLRGARVAWVDRDSCAGYLFPSRGLRALGLDPTQLFSAEQFSGSHGSAVRAVMRGEADVGATYAQLRDDGGRDPRIRIAGWFPWAGAAAMRAILTTEAIPTDVICASLALEPDERDHLRGALLSLHTRPGGAALIDTFLGGSRLVAPDPEHYEPVREALRARGEPL